ncbi:tripartite tricarboxylate transporter substrate-binding protein [Roseomonas sp. CCTCC AB2023176]|uniref:tripartite tricarboxylate transporter substrate-binding protein n=1 Tax=Roseomonas sp. CCTCC AB2023176 TaxID=3342640 RepID=UPI0035DA921A
MRRRAVFGLAGLAVAGGATAQGRPARLIVPFAAGGPADIFGRIFAEAFSASLGAPVVIENRAGAGGVIGTEVAARAAPDGTTFGFTGPGALSVAPAMPGAMPFDIWRDLAHLTVVVKVPEVLAVNARGPHRDVAALVAAAKAAPGALNFGSAGVGSLTHLAGALFASEAGIEVTHVPYRGAAPAATDLLAGRIEYIVADVPVLKPHIDSGAMRALAVTTAYRVPLLPDVPTTAARHAPCDLRQLVWFGGARDDTGADGRAVPRRGGRGVAERGAGARLRGAGRGGLAHVAGGVPGLPAGRGGEMGAGGTARGRQRAMIRTEMRGRVRLLVLDRAAKRNALDRAMTEALIAGLREAGEDPAVAAVVIRAEGALFCAGGDLEEMRPIRGDAALYDARVALTEAMLRAPGECARPVVAAVQGTAVGTGAVLALGCDMVVAAEDACFAFPEAQHGIFPSILPPILSPHLPRKRAFEVMATGGTVPAEEALRWGMVNRVVPPAALVGEAVALAEAAATLPPAAIAALKRVLARAPQAVAAAQDAARAERVALGPGRPLPERAE